jgi:hypothetical protein
MKPITDDLYKKIVRVSDEVKKELLRKGLVIPMDNADGSISIGNFRIVRKDNSFYSIVDFEGESIVDQINLPQSAIMLANTLALGRHVDSRIEGLDKSYGYALFEEQLHEQAVKNSQKKSLDYFDLMLTKCLIARAKKEDYKREIINSFEKLRKLV